jgi:hypothetical protein
MRADNTHHLRAAVQQRQRDARQRASAALADMQRRNTPISVAGLARAATVARSWVYSQPDLLAEIQNSRSTPPAPAPARTTATDDSWKQRLELAHGRIRELTSEVQSLRNQLARTHGNLRAQRTADGTTRTPSATQTHC